MVTILLCLLAMFVIGYFYLFDNFIASSFYRSLTDSSIPEKYDQFNCELPPNYWYYRGEEDEKILWKGITKDYKTGIKRFLSHNMFYQTDSNLPNGFCHAFWYLWSSHYQLSAAIHPQYSAVEKKIVVSRVFTA